MEFDTLGVSDLDGNIYATNVHLRWDRNNVSYGFLIPYDFLDLKSFNAHRVGAIGYGQYHLALSALATLDLTANANYTYTAVDTSDFENVNTFCGGVSVTLTLDKTWNLSPTWKLTGGYKKLLGLEDFDSNMVFLGTLWRF